MVTGTMTSQSSIQYAPLLEDDDALEAIWKKEYSLAAVTAADQFKSYEDLERAS